jgi:hypothetical protein
MGATPRDRLTQIPMPTRSTEAGGDCYGRTVLSYLRADEQRPASFFILGDILHRTIEYTINNDLDLDDTLIRLDLELAYQLGEMRDKIVVEGLNRNMESMPEDGERMITNWFAHVHPDSDKRHPFYDDFHWPPSTEVPFHNDNLGTRFPVWGSIDALFVGKSGPGALVDWKSSVKRPDSNFQLDYYRFGAELQDHRAAFHMLDRVRKQSIVLEAGPFPGEQEIREAISLTERAKQFTVAGQMPKFSPGWQCGYCTVQHICPVDGDPRNRDRNEKVLVSLLTRAEALQEIPGST